jgi:hypothetical protein
MENNMENQFKNFIPFEPLMKNRFLVRFNKEVLVPEYLFRKFKIKNEGEKLIFTTEIYETIEYLFNPSDLFKITDIEIDYLDPTGVVVNGLRFQIVGANMEQKCDYTKDGLMIIKFRFVVNINEVKLLYTNNDRTS